MMHFPNSAARMSQPRGKTVLGDPKFKLYQVPSGSPLLPLRFVRFGERGVIQVDAATLRLGSRCVLVGVDRRPLAETPTGEAALLVCAWPYPQSRVPPPPWSPTAPALLQLAGLSPPPHPPLFRVARVNMGILWPHRFFGFYSAGRCLSEDGMRAELLKRGALKERSSKTPTGPTNADRRKGGKLCETADRAERLQKDANFTTKPPRAHIDENQRRVRPRQESNRIRRGTTQLYAKNARKIPHLLDLPRWSRWVVRTGGHRPVIGPQFGGAGTNLRPSQWGARYDARPVLRTFLTPAQLGGVSRFMETSPFSGRIQRFGRPILAYGSILVLLHCVSRLARG